MKYTVTSVQNPAVKAIKKLSAAKARKTSGLFLAEGEKCVREALGVAQLCSQLFVLESDKEKYQDLLNGFSGDVFFISEPVLAAVTQAKSPQGILAVCKSEKLVFEEKDGLIVILDGISDPGNLGTIIRTADAAGAAGVMTLDESADILSPKVVRASMGSVLHLPVKRAALDDILALKKNGYTLLGADLSGETDFKLPNEKTGLVIGSEAHGISKPVLDLLDKRVKIPMYGRAESLNAAVAAGILIYRIIENNTNQL